VSNTATRIANAIGTLRHHSHGMRTECTYAVDKRCKQAVGLSSTINLLSDSVRKIGGHKVI